MPGSAFSPSPLIRSQATCASKFACICARGRAFRLRLPTNTRSTSPIAMTAASRVARPRKPSNCVRNSSRPATASIACNASMSAQPAAIIVAVGGIMIYTLATRDSEGISVIHDRNPMYVRLSDGALRNGYTIRIVNKQLKYRDFIVSVEGLPSTLVDFVGLPPRADGRQLISVGPDQSKEVRVVVTDYSTTPPAPSTSILFKLIDIDSGETA